MCSFFTNDMSRLLENTYLSDGTRTCEVSQEKFVSPCVSMLLPEGQDSSMNTSWYI